MITNLLSVEEVAKMLGLSLSFVYRLVRRKELTAVKIGTAVRIRPEDLEEFVRHNLTINGAAQGLESINMPRAQIRDKVDNVSLPF